LSLQPSCRPNFPALPHKTRQITYTTSLNNLREVISSLAYPGEEFSEHSMKRGVATESSQLFSDDQIREEGDWKSLSTARKYIDKNDNISHDFTQKLASIRKMI